MIRIRLQRTGRKKHPSYRIVIAEHSSPVRGKIIEVVGHYSPLSADKSTVLKKERILFYLQNGAQPTQTVSRLGVKHGLVELKPFIEERLMKTSKKELEEQKRKEEEKQKEIEAKKAKEEAVKAAEEEKKKAIEEAKAAEAATENTSSEPVQEEAEVAETKE